MIRRHTYIEVVTSLKHKDTEVRFTIETSETDVGGHVVVNSQLVPFVQLVDSRQMKGVKTDVGFVLHIPIHMKTNVFEATGSRLATFHEIFFRYIKLLIVVLTLYHVTQFTMFTETNEFYEKYL